MNVCLKPKQTHLSKLKLNTNQPFVKGLHFGTKCRDRFNEPRRQTPLEQEGHHRCEWQPRDLELAVVVIEKGHIGCFVARLRERHFGRGIMTLERRRWRRRLPIHTVVAKEVRPCVVKPTLSNLWSPLGFIKTGKKRGTPRKSLPLETTIVATAELVMKKKIIS